MKHLITVFTLFTCISSFCQSTYVPDDNFELALIEYGYDTAPLDNYVPTANINTITGLDLSSRNIKDLTGIEDFIILKSLECNDNQLSNLNVSGNSELRHLNCSENLLMNLDLTNNEFLNVISCNDNQISNLDLQSNIRLNYLECNNNLLTSINLSKNSDLVSIACSFNLLRKIDISQNLALKSLVCDNNKLSNLELKNNSKLRLLNFQQNTISTINLEQNIELMALNCAFNGMNGINISKNPNLTILDCSNNKIQTLDLLINKEITDLTCNNNNLSSLNLSAHKNLTSLNVSSNQLCELNIKNGANNSIVPVNFNSDSNPKLSCIIVDDANYSSTNWSNIDTNSNFVESQEDCLALGYSSVLVDKIEDTVNCNFFILPNLTNGNFYTESNGLGDLLLEGDEITDSKKLYIYNENNCGSNESSFNITIKKNSSLDEIEDVTICGSYSLPVLQHGNYYTESGGQGIQLYSGEFISITQKIYVFEDAKNNDDCPNEISFNVTIHPLIEFELSKDQIEIQQQSIFVNLANSPTNYLYKLDENPYQVNPSFFNISEGVHQLYVKDLNDCIEKVLSITIRTGYEIPKFFTPNNDGINDYWNVLDFSNNIKKISIFNRFGGHLKDITPNSVGWDGNLSGQPVYADNYWFLISFQSGETLKGYFALKR